MDYRVDLDKVRSNIITLSDNVMDKITHLAKIYTEENLDHDNLYRIFWPSRVYSEIFGIFDSKMDIESIIINIEICHMFYVIIYVARMYNEGFDDTSLWDQDPTESIYVYIIVLTKKRLEEYILYNPSVEQREKIEKFDSFYGIY